MAARAYNNQRPSSILNFNEPILTTGSIPRAFSSTHICYSYILLDTKCVARVEFILVGALIRIRKLSQNAMCNYTSKYIKSDGRTTTLLHLLCVCVHIFWQKKEI